MPSATQAPISDAEAYSYLVDELAHGRVPDIGCVATRRYPAAFAKVIRKHYELDPGFVNRLARDVFEASEGRVQVSRNCGARGLYPGLSFGLVIMVGQFRDPIEFNRQIDPVEQEITCYFYPESPWPFRTD